MSVASCRINIPPIKDMDSTLTVGRVFVLLCEGEFPKLNPEHLEFRLEETDKFKLKLLEFKPIDDKTVELVVTSYQAGNHNIKAPQLVDADQSVVLSDLQFSVTSVLKPEMQTEPYGPMGPQLMRWPLWIWLSIGLFVVLLGAWIFRRWYKYRQKKILLEELKKHDFSLSPFFQFQQKLRGFARTYPFISDPAMPSTPDEAKKAFADLHLAFQIYIGREFLVPTLKWPTKWVLKDLKQNHRRVYEELGADLRKIFSEIDRADQTVKENAQKLSNLDLSQLMLMTRKWSDRCEHFKKELNRRRSEEAIL